MDKLSRSVTLQNLYAHYKVTKTLEDVYQIFKGVNSNRRDCFPIKNDEIKVGDPYQSMHILRPLKHLIEQDKQAKDSKLFEIEFYDFNGNMLGRFVSFQAK